MENSNEYSDAIVVSEQVQKYTMLQRIKQANKEENPVLDYEIKAVETFFRYCKIDYTVLQLSE